MNNIHHVLEPRKALMNLCGQGRSCCGLCVCNNAGAPALPQNTNHELSSALAARKGTQNLWTLANLSSFTLMDCNSYARSGLIHT